MCSWNQTTWTDTAISPCACFWTVLLSALLHTVVGLKPRLCWCRKHVVICASHADRRRRGTEHGTWMAARHHHRRWRRVISRAQQQEAANRRADEHGRSRITKTYGKGQGREGEATPPSHGRSGLGIHRTTHVAGCSTAPNLGGLVAGHSPAANLLSDRHFDETGGTSVPPRGSERVGRPTSRAGPTTRTRISSHGRITGDSDAGHESHAGPAHDSEPAGTVDEHRHSPADGSWDHDGTSLQNQARGGHKTPVPSPGRNRSVGPQSRTMHHRSAKHGGHRTTEPSRADSGTPSQRSSRHGIMNQLICAPLSTICAVNTRPVLGKEFGPFSLPSADLVPLSL